MTEPNPLSEPGTALPPSGLLCELLEAPQHTRINAARPRFSWIVRDSAPGAHQQAYQIQVAADPRRLHHGEADMWDSQRRTGSMSLHIPYEGKPLRPHATYHWQVRTWNEPGDASAWSGIQTFHTGELRDEYAAAGYTLQQHLQRPAQLIHLAPGHVFVDFGKAAFGTLELTLDCPEACAIEVHLGEVRKGEHAVDRAPGDFRRYRLIQLDAARGRQTRRVVIPPAASNTQKRCILMPPDPGEVMPFRYAEIVGRFHPVAIEDIGQIVVTYPFNDAAARFICSNQVLNEVWELCRHTIKATSFCGLYVDGDRERIPYEQDVVVHQLGHYACDREYTLARRTLEHLMTHPTWPTEGILFSAQLAWADYLYTGDDALLDRVYDDLKLRLLTPLVRSDGLISVEEHPPPPDLLAALHFPSDWTLRDCIDWPVGERDGYDMVPVKTVVNAVRHHALTRMSLIAGVLGRDADARTYRQQAERTREAMVSQMTNRERGLFVDGVGSTHCSLHANMVPLALDLVPRTMRKNVLAFIKSKAMACSPYGAHFLLEGLYQVQEADHAFSLLTSTGERSWAHMIHDVGSTMTTEAWDSRLKPNQDWNHAWATAPANIIARYLMGVRPLEPGFARMMIHPQPGPLETAEMTLPTIRGPVYVRFEQNPARCFHLELDLPANTSAQVVLPRSTETDAAVAVDGRTRQATVHGRNLVIDPVGSGRHRFDVG